MYERELEQLGLSEKEARVYLAALELGAATVQEVAQKAGVRRPTAYLAFEELVRQGLLSWHERGKKRYVAAEFPDALLRVLVRREDELKARKTQIVRMLPALKDIFNHAKEHPRVRFFEGKEGLKAIQDDFLKTAKREALEIFSEDDVERVFSSTERNEQRTRRKEKKISGRYIYTRSAGPLPHAAPMTRGRYISAERFPIGVDLLIYEYRVAIASLRGKLVGVIIESKEIADTFRTIFELAWLGAGTSTSLSAGK